MGSVELRFRGDLLLAALFVVWGVWALGRAQLAVAERVRAASLGGQEPFFWRRNTPEVRALEAALQEAALPARTPVWIEAVGHERAFLWHWAQYLWPRADFLWPDDFSTFPGAPWRLRMEEKPTTLPAGGASTLRFVLVPGAPP